MPRYHPGGGRVLVEVMEGTRRFPGFDATPTSEVAAVWDVGGVSLFCARLSSCDSKVQRLHL